MAHLLLLLLRKPALLMTSIFDVEPAFAYIVSLASQTEIHCNDRTTILLPKVFFAMSRPTLLSVNVSYCILGLSSSKFFP